MTSTNTISNDYQYSSDNEDTVIHTPLSPSSPSLSSSPIVGTRVARATKRKTISSSSSDSNWSSDSDRTDTNTSDDSDTDSSSSSSSSRKAKKSRSSHVSSSSSSSQPRSSSLSVASANRPRYTKKGHEFRGKGRTGGEKCLTREAKMAIMKWCIDNWDRGVGQPNYKGPIANCVEMQNLAAMSGVSYEQVCGFLRNFRQRHFKQGIVYYRQRLHQLAHGHGRKPVTSPTTPSRTPTRTRRTKKVASSKEESKASLAAECSTVSPSLSSQVVNVTNVSGAIAPDIVSLSSLHPPSPFYQSMIAPMYYSLNIIMVPYSLIPLSSCYDKHLIPYPLFNA